MDLKKVCGLIGKYFGVIAVVFLGIGLFAPPRFCLGVGEGLRGVHSQCNAGNHYVRHGDDHQPS